MADDALVDCQLQSLPKYLMDSPNGLVGEWLLLRLCSSSFYPAFRFRVIIELLDVQ